MDKVVAEFGRVTTADPTLTQNEAIRTLQEQCRTLMYVRKIEHEDEQGAVYSVTCTIVVGSQTSYVATCPTEEAAIQCVISMAYDDLKHRLTFRKNEKYEPSNYELDSILASLRAFGYTVDITDRQRCDPISFGIHYRIFFTIPGLGVYIGESLLSYLDAYKNGAELVKTAFYEDFEFQKFTTPDEIAKFNDTLTRPNVEQQKMENRSGNASSSAGVLQMAGFESPPRFQPPPKDMTPPPNVDSKVPLLSVCDSMWIDLINRFNEVNLPARKFTEVIQELISMNLMRFTVVIDKFLNDKNRWQSLFITTLHFANYSIVSEELSEATSQERTFHKTYSMMKKMSSLMKTIQKVYDSNRSSIEMMEELMSHKEYSKIITERVKDCGRGNIEWRNKLAVITLGNMFRHEAYADTPIEAQEAAYWTVLNYLKNISEYIIDKPLRLGTSVCATRPSMPTTPAGTVPPATPAISQIAQSVAATSEYRPAIVDWVGPVSDEELFKAIKTLSTDLPPLTPITMNVDFAIARLGPLTKLIGRFNQVYTVISSPVEIMEHLFLIAQSFEVITEKAKKLNICKVKHPDLGIFTGVSSNTYEARFKAVSQTFEMLHKFAILVSSYKLIRSRTNSPASFRPVFVDLNQELICEKTWPISSHMYKTNFKVECLYIAFEDEGNCQEQSEERAFDLFVKFMDLFAKRIEGSITLNKPIHQDVVSMLGRYTYRRPVPIAPSQESFDGYKNPHGSGGGGAKVMELVLRFMQVQDIDRRRLRVEIIDHLMDFDRKLYDCNIKRDRSSKGQRQYITEFNVAHMGCFNTCQNSRISSKNEAFMRFYYRLHILARLVKSVQLIPLGTWTAQMVDLVCTSVAHIITIMVNTDERSVTMKVQHIGEFVATAQSLEQAKVDVFSKIIVKVLALREEALDVINTADNAALEALKMGIALDAANGHNVDASMAVRIKLLKDFESVYSHTKSVNAIVREMAARNDTFNFIQTKCQFNGESVEHTTSISIIDMAEFHGCGKQEEDSRQQANFAVFQYVSRLSTLLDDFKKLYSPSKLATQIIDELLYTGAYHLISIKKLNPNQLSDNQNLCVVQLDRMRSFGRMGPVMEDAYLEAATGAVDYLKKLCHGVYGPM